MKRRNFIRLATAAAITPPWIQAQERSGVDLRECMVVLSSSASVRESKAAQVLVEEAAKRCGISWSVASSGKQVARVTIYLATRQSINALPARNVVPEVALRGLKPDGFLLRSGQGAGGQWITVFGADERGLLFGVGKLLRLIDFSRQQASLAAAPLNMVSNPEYKLRGQQLGYRPKTNAYDGWSVEMWDQYIRDLAIFGNNAIELIPPRSDDLLRQSALSAASRADDGRDFAHRRQLWSGCVDLVSGDGPRLQQSRNGGERIKRVGQDFCHATAGGCGLRSGRRPGAY